MLTKIVKYVLPNIVPNKWKQRNTV